TLHPTPFTLHPNPFTLHPTPFTLHPSPFTLHPSPQTLHPSPLTPAPNTKRTLTPTPEPQVDENLAVPGTLLTPGRLVVALLLDPTGKP
ncbi:hypothetical protein T484DRAFT_1611833, partial [Baffinella frigidus]